jgi:hypothetical protein
MICHHDLGPSHAHALRSQKHGSCDKHKASAKAAAQAEAARKGWATQIAPGAEQLAKQQRADLE